MKYEYLLFDFDGTLVNTLEGVVKCAQHALKHFGFDFTLKELEPFLGPPLKVSFLEYGIKEEQIEKAIQIYRQRYEEKGAKECFLFPEIPNLLMKLKKAGYKLGVATSKYEKYAQNMINNFGISEYFDYITGANIDETISKKHEVIEESLRRFGIQDCREKALMIGDMKYDHIGAKIAKIDSFGIYTGTAQPNEHEDAGATYIAHSFSELEDRLMNDDF